MTLYLISLGLFEKEDMSFKAAKAAKKCKVLYLESYTSYYKSSIKELEKFIRKKISPVARQDLEENSSGIISQAKTKNIGILIIGDALSATTHNTLLLECKEKKIKYEIIHGSSIFTAVAASGLSLYKFGNTTSIPFDNKNIETPYNVIKQNKDMHTLMLLDLKNNKYMTTQEALKYLLDMEKKKKQGIFPKNRLCVIFFALGSKSPEIHAGTAEKLSKIKSNKKPQCMVIPGKLNFMEEELLEELQK